MDAGLYVVTDFSPTGVAVLRRLGVGTATPSIEPPVDPPPAGAGTPGVVQSLTLQPGNGHLVAEWTAPAGDGGSAVLGYDIHVEPGNINRTALPTVRAQVVSGLTNGTLYTVTIRARNSAGLGAPITRQTTPTSVVAAGSPPPPVAGDYFTMPSGVLIPPGWMTPATTGIRGAGLQLSDLTPSGSVSTSRPGQVIEGLDIDGGITLNHPDCVVRFNRVRYSGTGQAVRAPNPSAAVRAQMYYNTLEQPTSVATADVEAVYQLYEAHIHHNDISGFPDGLINLSKSVVEHNLVHDFIRRSGDHADASQFTIGSDFIIQHNTLLNFEDGMGAVYIDANGVHRMVSSSSFGNSICQLGSQAGPLTGFHFRRNYMSGGYNMLNANRTYESTHGAMTGRYYENVVSGFMKYGFAVNTPAGVTVERSNVWEATRDVYLYSSSTGLPRAVWHCIEGQPVQDVVEEKL